MIRPTWNHGHVIWQRAADCDEIPEAALLAHIDNGGTLVIEQEEQSIVVSPRAVDELCKVLRKLRDAATRTT